MLIILAQNLLDAAKLLNNEELTIKLSSCQNCSDLFAQDISYHKNCWSKFVTNVLRKRIKHSNYATAIAATNAEFLLNLENFLCAGKVSNMADIAKHYRDIACKSDVSQDNLHSRKTLKQMILDELPYLDISFTNSRERKTSPRLFL